MSRLVGFLRRNIVLVICLPSIALIHYSWYNLQFNRDFVEESERRPNPFEAFKTLSWFKRSETKKD